MKTIPITLRRTGIFTVADECEDSAQCGRVRGQRKLDYEVEIVSHSGALDDRGFVMENGDIQRYFDATYGNIRKFDSCELIATRAVLDLRGLAGLDRCMNVKVSISPQPLVKITAEQAFACDSHITLRIK
jgi:hypothetical protein